jgi:hypothetical protein
MELPALLQLRIDHVNEQLQPYGMSLDETPILNEEE